MCSWRQAICQTLRHRCLRSSSCHSRLVYRDTGICVLRGSYGNRSRRSSGGGGGSSRTSPYHSVVRFARSSTRSFGVMYIPPSPDLLSTDSLSKLPVPPPSPTPPLPPLPA